MQPHEFYIPTTWRIKGTAEQVHDVLSTARNRTAADTPLSYLAPLLTRVFAWNHRWAMQRGFEGLTRELTRRASV